MAFDDGQGISKNRIIAYALFNVAAGSKTSNNESVITSRNSVAARMSRVELDEAQMLTKELAKPRKLLLVLDEYITKKKIK